MRHFCANFFKAWLQSYNEFTWFYFPEKTTTKKTIILTAINFPSEISLSIFVSLPSQVCFCTSLPFSRVTTVCRGNRTETSLLTPAQKRPPQTVMCFLPSRHTDPCLPVVSGRLFKWLVELELDFSGFEGALSLHANYPLIVQGHYQIGLGPIAHLPGRKPHTCRAGGQHHQNALNIQLT